MATKTLKGKSIKTIGGFLALGLAISPIDHFVEHVLIGKVIGPSIDKTKKTAAAAFSSGDFLAAPLLISYCSNLPFGTQGKVTMAGILHTRNGGQQGLHASVEPHTAPVSHI